MSTRQPSLLRKAISVLASFALVFAFVPVAWADTTGDGGTVSSPSSLKFYVSDLNDLELSYRLGSDESFIAVTSSGATDGAVTISGIQRDTTVTVAAKIKSGSTNQYGDFVQNLRVMEGEDANAGPAYGGLYSENDNKTVGSYVFTADSGKDYVVRVEYKSENNSRPPVRIEVKNSQNGSTQYKIGSSGQWTSLTADQVWDIDGVSNSDTVYIKATPNAGQSLNQNGTQFWVDEGNGETTGSIDKAALQTDAGWSFSYVAGKNYRVYIEYQGAASSQSPVQIEVRNSQNGKTEYKVGSQSSWTEITGSEPIGIDSISNGDTVYVRAKPNQDQSIDAAATQLFVDGQSQRIDTSALSSDTGWSFEYTGGKQYQVQIEYAGDGGGSGGEPAHGGYQGDKKTASVTVTGKADFYINDSRMVNSAGGTASVDYTYAGNGKVDFYFNCFINQRITELKINGKNYYGELPDPTQSTGREALLSACIGQLFEFKIEADYSEEGYTIESSTADIDEAHKDYWVVGNFLWADRDDPNFQGGDRIDGGRIELVKAVEPALGYGNKYNDYENGTVLYDASDPNNITNNLVEDSCRDWSGNSSIGSAVFPAGTRLTVRLIPDYGKQLTQFSVREATESDRYTYTFIVQPGNFHLGAVFTSRDDVVMNSGTTSVTGVGVGASSKAAPVDTGTLRMTVTGAEADSNTKGAVAAAEITVDNVVYAGTLSPNEKWTTRETVLKAPVTVGLKVDGVEAGDEVQVIREHEVPSTEDPGTTTTQTDVLTATVTTDGTVQFDTDRFSKYTIVMVKKSSGNTSTGGGGTYVPPVYVPVAPAPQPEVPPITNAGSGDSASATVDVTDKVTTTETGSTQVAVDAELGNKIVENAVANNVADVVIKAETSEGSSSASTVALPASTVKELAEKTEASVTISTDSAQVTLDSTAVAAVAEQAGGDGSVQLVVQTSEQNKNKVQIEVTLQTSNGTVSDFRGGSVRISVPVSEELAAKKIVCVYIDANGKYTKMPGALSADGKSYVFSTGHFSTYAVMSEEEADAAIAEQEKAEAEALAKAEAAAIAAAKPGTPSVKLSSPAKGKLTVKATAKKATGYRVYYKKAGWKAYKTFTTTGTVKSLSKTFKKLSKGSYTVKVRAFGKTAAGKTVWGAKSKAKKISVK